MPTIIIKLNRQQAVNLHDIAMEMDGNGAYKAAYSKLRADIFRIWPEIHKDNSQPTTKGEIRDFELDPKRQRALAEGFLRMADNPKNNGYTFDFVKTTAQFCRVWGWVETHLMQKQMEDFEGILDEEPPLVDRLD